MLVNAVGSPLFHTMTMMSAVRHIERTVLALVAEKFHAGMRAVTPRTDLRRDLGADSLAMVELVMLLETEFQVDIPDEDAEEIATVQQVIDYLRDETHARRS